MIRPVVPNDIIVAKELHEKFYQEQFAFPDFRKEFLMSFTSINKEGQLVSLAGVRQILEFVAITDQTKPVRERHTAVYDILAAAMFTAGINNYHQLHAFVQDPHWAEVMKKRGFTPIKGEGLVYG